MPDPGTSATQPRWGAVRRVPRLLAATLLGLQALLWGGGSILEARAAAESLAQVTHIEDESDTACPPIHSHVDCLVCRTLTGGATGGSAPALPSLFGNAVDHHEQVAAPWADGRRFGHLGPRAPPSVRAPRPA